MRGGKIADIDVDYQGARDACGASVSVVRVEFVVDNDLLFPFLEGLKSTDGKPREPIMAIVNHYKVAGR